MRIIIIGAGHVGLNIAGRLAQEKKDVVLVDRNEKPLIQAAEQLDVQTLEGSGSSPEVLKKAGVTEASILMAVTDSDETNLIACAFANLLSPGTLKLARIRNDEYFNFQELWTENLGISMVINPEIEVVQSIYRIMRAPGAVEVNDFADGRIKLMGVMVEKDSVLENVSLMDVRDRLEIEDLIVAAIVRSEKLIIPTGTDRFRNADLAYIACRDKDLEKVADSLGARFNLIRKIMVIGGGNIGFRLAEFLEKRAFTVKLLDINEKNCRTNSEKLDKTLVIHGDGTNQDILLEENIKDMDLVATLTKDDETNILSSLLARKLGAGMTITRINKPEYTQLVRTIGLKHIVSPRLSAVNSILNHVRKGSIISAVAIREDIDVMEAVIKNQGKIAGKSIKDLDLPQGSLVLAILRNQEAIIPSGDTVIRSGDRITLLASRQCIDRLEKSLTAKMEYF
ncbi:MAG: Trk system potassium transporter TrkA [Desulfonatronovibrionaceae bacterium]